jgi:hypothetical protein
VSDAPAGGLAGLADRLLAVTADAGETSLAGRGDAPVKLDDFRRFLLIWTAGRSALWAVLSPSDFLLLVPLALVAATAAVLAFRPRHAARAPWPALAVVAVQVAWRFPATANHVYLELVCLLFLAGVRRDVPGDAARALSGLRWTTALVLFHTGLQKLLYGLYFRGEFLALMAGAEERFGRVFRWLLAPGELARLEAIDRHQTGAGPFRVAGPWLPLAANAVWIAELTFPLLLLARRTRVLGVLGGLALMLGIQAAALELGFALLFVNLLVLFLPGRWNARLLPVSAAVVAWGLGAALGWLPGHPGDWNLM